MIETLFAYTNERESRRAGPFFTFISVQRKSQPCVRFNPNGSASAFAFGKFKIGTTIRKCNEQTKLDGARWRGMNECQCVHIRSIDCLGDSQVRRGRGEPSPRPRALASDDDRCLMHMPHSPINMYEEPLSHTHHAQAPSPTTLDNTLTR